MEQERSAQNLNKQGVADKLMMFVAGGVPGGLIGWLVGSVLDANIDASKPIVIQTVIVGALVVGGIALRAEYLYQREKRYPESISQPEYTTWSLKPLVSSQRINGIYQLDHPAERMVYNFLNSLRNAKMPPLNQPLKYDLPWRK